MSYKTHFPCLCASVGLSAELIVCVFLLIEVVLTEILHWFSSQPSPCCLFRQLVLFWSINSSIEELCWVMKDSSCCSHGVSCWTANIPADCRKTRTIYLLFKWDQCRHILCLFPNVFWEFNPKVWLVVTKTIYHKSPSPKSL